MIKGHPPVPHSAGPTGVLLHPVRALCIDNNKTPTLFLQALIEEVLRHINDCDPMINTIAISALLVLTDVIFHLNRDSSVLWVGIETYAVKSYSLSPTSVFFSSWIKCSVKRELSMFFSSQQNESSQVKQRLSASMNCNFLKHFDYIGI